MYNRIKNQSKDVKRLHPSLGYDMDAPLPYFLTDEDIYGEVPKVDKENLDNSDWMTPITLTLSNFLKEGAKQNYTGNVPTISEAVFVKSYLPHFYSGYLEDPDEEKDFSVAGAWIYNVSGHAYQHVDVVREGEVIYRVPPIMGRLNIIHSGERERSIALMYKDADDMMQRLPSSKLHQINNLANNLFNPSDPNKDRKEFRSKTNAKFLFTLDDIFTYYGYPSILPEELMKVKQLYLTGEIDDYKSSGAISESQQSQSNTDDDWDDESLFG